MELRYTKDINLCTLSHYIEQQGEEYTYDTGERMEQEGEPSRWVAIVKQGSFKYMIRNLSDHHNYTAWVSFEEELVGDYPGMLTGEPAQWTIEAIMPSTVQRVSRESILRFFSRNSETRELRAQMAEYIARQFQARYSDFHRFSPLQRYLMLLSRCPGILNELPLQEIASIINITPNYLSILRKQLTFKGAK